MSYAVQKIILVSKTFDYVDHISNKRNTSTFSKYFEKVQNN